MREPDHDRYAAYLTSHLAGAWNGVHVFVAATRTWRDTEHEPVFRDLVREISTDRDELQELVVQLGYGPGPARQVLFRASAVAGRVNPVNLIRKRRRAAAQLELEQLTSLIRAKHSLWQTLVALADVDDRLDADWLQERANLAASQEQRLIRSMLSTAAERFMPA